jgi:hypothetical protein
MPKVDIMATRSTHPRSPRGKRRWSQRVTETSDAMDITSGILAKDDPAAIARSLKHSAEASKRRKSSPFRSAMSMLNFYINRAGKQLSEKQRAHLNAAKDELRVLFGRAPRRKSRRRRA